VRLCCTGRIEHCLRALKQVHESDTHSMTSCCFSLVKCTVLCVLSRCESELCFRYHSIERLANCYATALLLYVVVEHHCGCASCAPVTCTVNTCG
jgi:hypothetical protein